MTIWKVMMHKSSMMGLLIAAMFFGANKTVTAQDQVIENTYSAWMQPALQEFRLLLLPKTVEAASNEHLRFQPIGVEPAPGKVYRQLISGELASEIPNGAEPMLRYDIGEIAAWAELIDGRIVIEFDRWQSAGNGRQGTDWAEEPYNAGASDAGFWNTNPMIRTYIVSADAEAYLLTSTWYRVTCSNANPEGLPMYKAVNLRTFIDSKPLVSLTFDDHRMVVTVRDQRGC